MSLILTRKKILKDIKVLVIKDGWNDQLFFNYSKISKFSNEEINALFPEGYKTLIDMYLEEINLKMTKNAKKINLIRLRTHERVRELVKLKLSIMLKEKILVKKTFIHLLLPFNHRIAYKNLYRTVDQIWFLAGDNSTDFNFYSKRMILAIIYTSTISHFINNDDYQETINFLEKNLKKVSLIPKLKNKTKNFSEFLLKSIKFKKYFSSFTQ